MIDYDPGRVNREQWLSDMANLMRPMFRAAGMDVPTEVRVSCGWTSKGGKGKAALSRMGDDIGGTYGVRLQRRHWLAG